MAPPVAHQLRLVVDNHGPAGPGGQPHSAPADQDICAGRRKPLGQILLDMKAVDPGHMLSAVTLRSRQNAGLGDILLAHGWVREADLMAALSLQWGARNVDLVANPPDTRLMDAVGARFCLDHGVIPWRRIGAATVFATARPEAFAALRARLPARTGPVIMALAPERDIHTALIAARQTTLVQRAETRVDPSESCRVQDGRKIALYALALLALVALGAIFAPIATVGVFSLWAVVTLVAVMAMKVAGFAMTVRHHDRPDRATAVKGPLPVVSVMVPLFKEDDIAPRLIRRLGRIDYPKELFDVLLVVEEDDRQTQNTLAVRSLPRWMRVVIVPQGTIRTKPRALNYALDFCRGSIVGIWDAEDAPEAGQIHTVVRHFQNAGPEVGCLQGILDFYDAGHNWLTRCFTVEYASWFRAVLPGLARLGFVVPLGGTTLFLRREVIEKLGGWDAHNVTEDADLGVRLARHGYRTEMIPTVTEEEPNARPLAWIRQRSRWQKGFAMTWASHMRDPARLWRDLGPRGFLSVQILFVATLSQSLLAPFLWSFWLLALGLPHPLSSYLPSGAVAALACLFVTSEAVNITIGAWATRRPKHRHLRKWVPSLYFYHPLGALSSYKALYECVRRPFYWDKTSHGAVTASTDGASSDLLPVLMLTDPVALPQSGPDAGIPAFCARRAGQDGDFTSLTFESDFRAARRAQLTLVKDAGQPDRPAYRLGSAIAGGGTGGIEIQLCFAGFDADR